MHCMSCKKHTASSNVEEVMCKNGRMRMKGNCNVCGGGMSQFVSGSGSQGGKTGRKTGGKTGGKVDLHGFANKFLKPILPDSGFTPGKYKYMGPFNPLEDQLDYDKKTGVVKKWHVKPLNKVDEISAHHDICYDMGTDKGVCDRKMVGELDKIPSGKMPKWGHFARFVIDKKQQWGLGNEGESNQQRFMQTMRALGM